jgi:hypothetical protein
MLKPRWASRGPSWRIARLIRQAREIERELPERIDAHCPQLLAEPGRGISMAATLDEGSLGIRLAGW